MESPVTEREELAPLTSGETIEGYLPDNKNIVKSLAAHVDATDFIYFEGALTDRPGGVVRVEIGEWGSIMYDLAHVLPGYTVTGIEPLAFTPESTVERAIDDGDLELEEWNVMSEQEQDEFIDERREQFRDDNGIQYSVDRAMRIELVGR